MNPFEQQQSETRRRRSQEAAEIQAEQKEKQAEEQEKKMAARERIEQTSREVKTTKQQIQNIVANMQAVIKAVAAIRAQLQMAPSDDDIPSVERDKKVLENLRRKLDGLLGEIKDLRVALLAEEAKAAQAEHQTWSAEEITKEAGQRVAEILRRLGLA